MKILIITLFHLISFALAKNENKKTSKNISEKRIEFPSVPNLSSEEFAYLSDDKYVIFKIQLNDEIEYSGNCFKNKKIDCDAYRALGSKQAKQMSAKDIAPAAAFCQQHGGVSILAVNKEKKEFSFCRFKDGSLFNSWSAYFKDNPPAVVK